jgi:hypothetical protein
MVKIVSIVTCFVPESAKGSEKELEAAARHNRSDLRNSKGSCLTWDKEHPNQDLFGLFLKVNYSF